MAAETSASVLSILLLLCLSVGFASDVITARLGETVTLPCSAQKTSTMVEWKRSNLEPEHVFVHRDGWSDPDNQHPSYINRVELADPQMKGGNVSVILKKVKISDTGTYECHVRYGGRSQLISIIDLTVTASGGGAGRSEEEGDKDGHVGLTVGVTVTVLLVVVVVVVVVIYRKLKGLKQETSY